MALAAAVWFFYQEDVEVKPTVPAKPEVSYEVTDIKATQTNPQTGQIEYTLTAKSLVQENGQEYMIDANMDWQASASQSYHLTASRITLNQDTGDMVINEGFELSKKDTADNQSAMVIQGEILTGNTKTKQVSSDKPIKITQANHSFEAQSFEADLSAGEYQFKQIAIQFDPTERQDKPLF